MNMHENHVLLAVPPLSSSLPKDFISILPAPYPFYIPFFLRLYSPGWPRTLHSHLECWDCSLSYHAQLILLLAEDVCSNLLAREIEKHTIVRVPGICFSHVW
jgi:hypothetical protein